MATLNSQGAMRSQTDTCTSVEGDWQVRVARTAIGSLLAIAIWTVHPLAATAQASLPQILQEAVEAAAAEDWQTAVGLYRRAIEISPEQASLYNNLGVALRQVGDVPAAVAAYRQALELDPNFAQAYGNLTVLLAIEQRWSEALDVLAQAQQVGVTDPQLNLYRGLVFEKFQRWQDSAAAYGMYLRSDSSALVSYRAAIANWQAGNGREAIRLFERAASLDPAFGLYVSEAGLALAKTGGNRSAIQLLGRLPETWANPTDFVVLARIATELDMLDLAEASLRRAFLLQERNADNLADSAAPPAIWTVDAGAIAAEQGNLDEAIAQFQAAAEQARGNPVTSTATRPLTLFDVIESSGETEVADPDNQALALASANLAETYLRQDRYALALSAGQAAVEAAPSLPVTHNNFGAALLAVGSLSKALDSFYRALELNPQYWQAQRNLALTYAHLGDRDRANSYLKQAMDNAPTLATVRQLNEELINLQRLQLPEPLQEVDR
ncbi:tetratricopeptide repeat protein [Synechococcus sp. PCC 7336]|uniref:tetratricopeptide repeat protein n=1 Tax=Synechococcus sp. PCC 7336 TaxID=195250 RepID=UPI00034A6F3F|nr:tetratricopeptide repeat protein [Synechococcus sp. PCC 7336]